MIDVDITPRLFMFQTGSLKCRYQDVYLNQGLGQDYEIPVPWYLVTHRHGHVVIDGGFPRATMEDPIARWGAVSEVFRPLADASQDCAAQLEALGIARDEIAFVLLSHLHLDHTGAIGQFPKAAHIVQRREINYCASHPTGSAGVPSSGPDFDRPELQWRFIEDDWDDAFDLYGDGAIRCIRTPGHTVGHQSFLVQTADNKVLLAIDAADTFDHWNETALPGAVASVVDSVRSVAKLRMIAARCSATVICGHDPEQWRGMRMAPDYF